MRREAEIAHVHHEPPMVVVAAHELALESEHLSLVLSVHLVLVLKNSLLLLPVNNVVVVVEVGVDVLLLLLPFLPQPSLEGLGGVDLGYLGLPAVHLPLVPVLVGGGELNVFLPRSGVGVLPPGGDGLGQLLETWVRRVRASEKNKESGGG